MTKTLTELPKVGDKVRYVGEDSFDFLTDSGVYEVIEAGDGEFSYKDDEGQVLIETRDDFKDWELVEGDLEDVGDKADQIRQACDEVRDLLIRKNHDYGDSFAQQYAKYGLLSALIRMDDKMRRLETLNDGTQAQVAESIEDSLADLAGYALLALVEARKGSRP